MNGGRTGSRRRGCVRLLATSLTAGALTVGAVAAQTPAPVPAPAASPAPAAPPALPDQPTAAEIAAELTRQCQAKVISRSFATPLIFYNQFRRDVGHVEGKTAPGSLEMRIADCDAYYYYIDATELVKAGFARQDAYIGGRAAIRIKDVEAAVPLPPPPKPEPAQTKPKATAKKAAKKKS